MNLGWCLTFVAALGTGSFVVPLSAATDSAVVGGAAKNASVSDPFPPASPQNVVAVTKKLFPAVVRIDAGHPNYAEGRMSVERGIGSGVIFDPKGLVLTNFHVAGRATELHVTLFNKERVKATLVGDDHWTDLAIVQMDMNEIREKKIDFASATLGDSSTLVPGQDVMAIGTPFGLARTLTLGTVSNVERTLYPDRLKIEDYETGEYSNWIQMDVPINPGNSGGPLVDLAGNVVGINTRGGAQELNFAIPINTAKFVISAILRNESPGKIGHVRRADLGMELKPMQDLEAFYKLNPNQGVLVDDVSAFSPARLAGVQPQDVLLAIDQKPANVRFPEELAPIREFIAELPIGKPVKLLLLRDGRKIEVTATPTKLVGAIGEEAVISDWGLSVREVTPDYAASNQLPSVRGVTVTGVTPDSAAFKAGLQPDDVIVTVNSNAVGDLESFQSAHSGLVKTRQTQAMLNVEHGLGKRLVLMDLSAAAEPATTSASQ